MKINLHLKRKFQLLALLTLIFLGAKAQTTITVGSGTTTNAGNTQPCPYGAWYSQSRVQMLILASELNALGLTTSSSFNSVSFNVTNTNGAGAHQNFTVKMKNTTATVVTTTWDNTGLILVHTSSSHTPATGWNLHTFSPSFMWDGVSNVLVDVCHDNGNNSYTATPQVENSVTSFVSVLQAWSDSQSGIVCPTGIPGSTYSNRPNMRFQVISGAGGPPQPPIANFYAPDTVWINSPATLINTSSFQSRVFWDFPNENPLQTGY
jgi:hypothetical protein